MGYEGQQAKHCNREIVLELTGYGPLSPLQPGLDNLRDTWVSGKDVLDLQLKPRQCWRLS